jgi:hypothetical protein
MRLANIVIWSHTLPAITQLFNADFANPDRDIVGNATAALMRIIEGLIVELRSARQFTLEA